MFEEFRVMACLDCSHVQSWRSFNDMGIQYDGVLDHVFAALALKTIR